MSSAGGVRAGRTFVEITANDSDFQRGMKRVQHSVVRLGGMMRQIGSGMLLAGGAMGLPMVMAARSASTFEDALLELKGAASDLTSGELKAIREESLRLSAAMGVAPEKISQAFALLVKAGMTVEEALAGGARAAVEFAKVSGVEAAQAAEFMSDAMNVFGLSASEAADTLSSAADASSTSIASMVEGFGQVAGVAKVTGQSLFGLSQGMAVLAGFGIKGEEAGTGIKTVLTKLIAPTDEAKAALASLGISMGELVDSSGKLLPMAQIAGVFEKRLASMGANAEDVMLANEALVKVFDVRGIKVMAAFAESGVAGFNEMADKMETARTVSEKFSMAMSGISGHTEMLVAAVQRLAIAFMQGAGPAMGVIVRALVGMANALSFVLERMPVLSGAAVAAAATLVLFGGAAYALGGAMAFLNFGLINFINFSSTFVLAVRSMTSIVGGFSKALVGLRVAMMAIPGWGWALAAVAAAGGLAAWMFSGSGSDGTMGSGEKSGIQRDQDRAALGGGMPAARGAGGGSRGESIGTFAGMVASQLGIGPSLTAQEQTASNTARMADGVEALVAQGESRVPSASSLQAGMASPGIQRGVAASGEKDLVSISEKIAIACQHSEFYLRQLVEKMPGGGVTFA